MLLSQYGARDRACAKVFRVLLVVAAALGGYAFYVGGLSTGLFVLVGALVGAVILNLITMKVCVVRDFSPMRYGLTPIEVNFALKVVADSQWQRDLPPKA